MWSKFSPGYSTFEITIDVCMNIDSGMLDYVQNINHQLAKVVRFSQLSSTSLIIKASRFLLKLWWPMNDYFWFSLRFQFSTNWHFRTGDVDLHYDFQHSPLSVQICSKCYKIFCLVLTVVKFSWPDFPKYRKSETANVVYAFPISAWRNYHHRSTAKP